MGAYNAVVQRTNGQATVRRKSVQGFPAAARDCVSSASPAPASRSCVGWGQSAARAPQFPAPPPLRVHAGPAPPQPGPTASCRNAVFISSNVFPREGHAPLSRQPPWLHRFPSSHAVLPEAGGFVSQVNLAKMGQTEHATALPCGSQMLPNSD